MGKALDPGYNRLPLTSLVLEYKVDGIKRVLSAIWKTWKRFGILMGEIVGRVFLMIFYFTIALPFGIGVRLFGDPLDMKKGKQAQWIERESKVPSIEASYNQF